VSAVQRALASGLLPPSPATSAQVATEPSAKSSVGSTSSSPVIDQPGGASPSTISEPSEAQRPPLPNGHEPKSESPPPMPPPASSSLGAKTSFRMEIETPVAVKAKPAKATRKRSGSSATIAAAVKSPPPPSKPLVERTSYTPRSNEIEARFAGQMELS